MTNGKGASDLTVTVELDFSLVFKPNCITHYIYIGLHPIKKGDIHY